MSNEFIKKYVDARGGVDSLSREEKKTLTEMASTWADSLSAELDRHVKSQKKKQDFAKNNPTRIEKDTHNPRWVVFIGGVSVGSIERALYRKGSGMPPAYFLDWHKPPKKDSVGKALKKLASHVSHTRKLADIKKTVLGVLKSGALKNATKNSFE